MSSAIRKCFHCHEDIPKNLQITAEIRQSQQAVCCYGCKAVAEFIDEQGYDEFYDYRGESKPSEKAQVAEDKWLKLDQELNFDAATQFLEGNDYHISLRIEGLYCSACGWLIDKHLSNLKGIKKVQLNTISKILHIEFDVEEIKLSQILSSINHLGYQPVIAKDTNSAAVELQERKTFLKRLMLAGFGMMQVMTMSVPLYSDSYNIEPNIKRFFELVSLMVATLVFFYSGKVFLKNAWRDLSNKHLGMDVPVALSITIAYVASCWNVFSGNQQIIYFDSMIMFIFFLLAGRYVEMSVRHQGMDSQAALSSLVPTSVTVIKDSQDQLIPLVALQKADLVKVNAGETIACDGQIVNGNCEVDESLITGESVLVKKSINDTVTAGTQVKSGSIHIQSTAIGDDTLLASLAELLEKAQLQKPKTLLQIDKIAVWFVASVLLLAGLCAIYYSIYQPEQTISILLAVLVATCPCALSLATPTVLTAATVALLRKGILVNKLDSLTKVSQINHWFFDKTGTLTQASMSVQKIHNFSKLSEQKLLSLMAALENQSSHPVASAFNDYYDSNIKVESYIETSGFGVQAIIDQAEYKAGSYLWCGLGSENDAITSENTLIYLSKEKKLLAAFELSNQLRKKSKKVIAKLLHNHQHVSIISGDKKQAVKKVADELNIQHYAFEQSPQQKINRIRQSQSQSKGTIMVGDGVNDAPVLGQSDVSISFNQGTHIARAASDLILMGNSLSGIDVILRTSKKANQIIKQNIIWALIYNLSITPLAITGYLAPWMAALGMSFSSLIVILNARRVLNS